MRRLTLRSWKTAAVLVVISAAAVAVLATGAFASSHAKVVKVAIMTDCKGAFAFGYDVRHRRRAGCVRAVRPRCHEEPCEAVRRA